MPGISFTAELAASYQQLFDTCQALPQHLAAIDTVCERAIAARDRYQGVALPLGLPWCFVAVVHNMEAGGRFDRHLHNGDPLGARTIQVPAGRPRTGAAPFTWEASADDALRLHGVHRWTDWSVPGLLYQLEGYNGWGYRLYHPHVLSPYLWAASNHYTAGKYVADGRWSDTAVSKQLGAAAVLRRIAERGALDAPDLAQPAVPSPQPELRYAPDVETAPMRALQAWLNTRPGIHLRVDGKGGQKTSDALRSVTGSYLVGDPRAR